MSRTDRILEIIDTGLQTAMPDPSFGEISPTVTEECWRCEAGDAASESGLCEPCRVELLAERPCAFGVEEGPPYTHTFGGDLSGQIGIGRESVYVSYGARLVRPSTRSAWHELAAVRMLYEVWWGESCADAELRRIREGVEAFREAMGSFVEAARPVFQEISETFRRSLDQLNAALREDVSQMVAELPAARPLDTDRPFVLPVWGETPWRALTLDPPDQAEGVFRRFVLDRPVVYDPVIGARSDQAMAMALAVDARRSRPFVCQRHGEQPGGFCRRCERGR